MQKKAKEEKVELVGFLGVGLDAEDGHSILWAERQGTDRPLKLSEVYDKVCKRRNEFGDALPALSTVSTHLRGLTRKHLIEEVAAPRELEKLSAVPTRGTPPPSRSP